MKMARQGDVLLVRADGGRPDDATPVPPQGGRVIVALGELTGHAHAVAEDRAALWRAGREEFLEVRAPAELVHPEHAPIPLEPGLYKVVHQREYHPNLERPVRD